MTERPDTTVGSALRHALAGYRSGMDRLPATIC